MTDRIELGSGQWVDVRGVEDLRSGDRKTVLAAFKVEIDPATNEARVPGDTDDIMRRKLLTLIIEGWNLPYQLPSKKPDVLDNLTLAQEDALFEGIEPQFKAIKGVKDDEGGSPDGEPDPTGLAS